MVNISIANTIRSPLSTTIWIKCRFLKTKHRNMVYLGLTSLGNRKFANYGFSGEITSCFSDTKKYLWVNFRIENSLLDLKRTPNVESKDAAEACKRYIEGVLLDAAIKGDLNTKQEDL